MILKDILINKGEITELSYDLNESIKDIDILQANGIISMECIQHWLNLCRCLLPDCKEFIRLYQINCACQYPVCFCKMTCTCGKCAYCDVQKFQNLYNKFSLLAEYHAYSNSCKEAIEDYDNYLLENKDKYWKRKHYKLYDKLALFHYHFDKYFDTHDHEGYEGRVFVNDEIEADWKDFESILVFLRLYDGMD